MKNNAVSDKKIRLAVLGNGPRGTGLAGVYALHPNIAVVAQCCDIRVTAIFSGIIGTDYEFSRIGYIGQFRVADPAAHAATIGAQPVAVNQQGSAVRQSVRCHGFGMKSGIDRFAPGGAFIVTDSINASRTRKTFAIGQFMTATHEYIFISGRNIQTGFFKNPHTFAVDRIRKKLETFSIIATFINGNRALKCRSETQRLTNQQQIARPVAEHIAAIVQTARLTRQNFHIARQRFRKNRITPTLTAIF